MKAIVLWLLILLLIFLVVVLYQVAYKAARLPENNPKRFLKKIRGSKDQENEIIVCIGDSITHGHIGVSYVKLLRQQLDSSVDIVNAGINSEHAYNVVQRLDDIIILQPDYITILIGTNDVNNTLSCYNAYMGRYLVGLPRFPDLDLFNENFRLIIERLQKETDAAIAVLSIPTISEDPDHLAYEKSREYACLIKNNAAELGVDYLPLFETMDKALNLHPSETSKKYEGQFWQQLGAIIRHYLFGTAYDEIAELRRFNFHIDQLHLNSEGAGIVADLIADFYKKSKKKRNS